MARVKYGSIVTSLSGSVGTATFQKSASGAILRSKPIPLHSRTEGQLACRSKMQSLQNAWISLTPAARAKWIYFVAFSGQHITRDDNVLISGYNLFLKYQFARLLCNLPLLTSWTYNPLLVFPKSFNLNTVGPTSYIYFNSILDATKYFFILKLSYPHSAAQRYSSRNSLYMSIPVKSDYLFYITGQYLAGFGILPPVGATLSWSIYWFSIVNPILTGYDQGTLVVNTL
jgi:hypothetical protein